MISSVVLSWQVLSDRHCLCLPNIFYPCHMPHWFDLPRFYAVAPEGLLPDSTGRINLYNISLPQCDRIASQSQNNITRFYWIVRLL